MSTLRLEDLKQYSDMLRTRHGEALHVRFVEPRDTEELQHYFRSLSTRSRYNRFFGAISELPQGLLHEFLQCRRARTFHRGRDHDGRRLRDHRRRSALRAACRNRDTRIRPVGCGPLAGPRHSHRADEESRMPRGRARRRSRVRRHAALQRGHDLARPQIRLRLRQSSRRLEAGALRQGDLRRTERHSLRELAPRRSSRQADSPSASA